MFASHHPATAETIVLGTGEYAPYTSAEMKNGGFVTEIVKRTFAEIGIKAEIRFMSWQKSEAAAEKGKLDGVFPHIRSAKRDAKF